METTEERKVEEKIPGSKEAISLAEAGLEEKENCFCKIYGNKTGTGFFSKIKYKDTLIPVLITNYHIIDNKYMEENNFIKFYINNKYQIIDNINKNDIIYPSPNENDKYDIIIIKLKENDRDIINYLEIDENIFQTKSELYYKNEPIYILHYPNSREPKVSYGKGLEKINDYDMKYLCHTEPESSGGPILSYKTNKVIGIHKLFDNNKKYNIGTFLKFPLNELNENYNNISVEVKIDEMDIKNKMVNVRTFDSTGNNNEIKIKIKIDKIDINKKIYFIYNKYQNKWKYIKPNKDLEDLNETNTKLYINDKEEKYKNYFIPEKEGIYLIKLKFYSYIQDCSHIFYGCKNLIDINLSSFNVSNVTNMDGMFEGCRSLMSLSGISEWDTSNVEGMRSMFCGCYSLKSLPDISKWNISNVRSMGWLFLYCESLISLPDISKWNTSNVIWMHSMFDGCESLASLPDISKWNTDNLTDISEIFNCCKSLISLPNISKWNTSEITDMSNIFKDCKSLISLPDISKWNTSNVKNMKGMFDGCYSLISLPDISKWNTSKIIDMNNIFNGCHLLINGILLMLII